MRKNIFIISLFFIFCKSTASISGIDEQAFNGIVEIQKLFEIIKKKYIPNCPHRAHDISDNFFSDLRCDRSIFKGGLILMTRLYEDGDEYLSGLMTPFGEVTLKCSADDMPSVKLVCTALLNDKSLILKDIAGECEIQDGGGDNDERSRKFFAESKPYFILRAGKIEFSDPGKYRLILSDLSSEAAIKTKERYENYKQFR